MALEKNNVVVVEHEFEASPSKVFAALKAGRLFFNCGAWPDGTEIDFRVGGKYRFAWGHYGATTGEFLEILENKRIVFTWIAEMMDVTNSTVAIDLKPRGSGCAIQLRHEGLPNREVAESHDGGWTAGLKGFDNELCKGEVKLDREFLVPHEMLYEACAGANFFAYMGATKANSEIDFRVGGRYRASLENGNTISGEFLEIQKNKRIVFTWEASPCGAPLKKPTRVQMEFGPWGDGGKNSYLELIHSGFSDQEESCSHQIGWNKIFQAIYNKVSR